VQEGLDGAQVAVVAVVGPLAEEAVRHVRTREVVAVVGLDSRVVAVSLRTVLIAGMVALPLFFKLIYISCS
jgi:hypothetical protein